MADQLKIDHIMNGRRLAGKMVALITEFNAQRQELLAQEYGTGEAHAIVTQDITDMNGSNLQYPQITLAQWDQFVVDMDTMLDDFLTITPGTPKLDASFYQVKV